MAAKEDPRLSILYFEGVNSTVQHTISKIQELAHAENVRSNFIGTMEKRQGQAKVGTTSNGSPFYATANYGLTKFVNNGSNKGIFRISTAPSTQDPATLTVSIFDLVFVGDYVLSPGGNQTPLQVKTVEYITVSEPIFLPKLDGNVIILDGTSNGSSVYALSKADIWTVLSDGDAQNIIGANADFARVDDNLVMVNGRDYNRMISSDGTTVIPSTSAGSLYNSPRAKKVAFYKNRMYLANITRNGIQHKTTVMRSSYPLGIVALLNGDYPGNAPSDWVIPVTEIKYFYSDSGMNSYEIYRGITKIATIVISSIQSTTVTATNGNVTFEAGYNSFLSSDEIWITGTFMGQKQYRWVGGSTSVGRDVKQYDTFKLVGGDEDEINMMVLIGNVMLISNKNAMMTWNDYMLENMDLGVGCVSPRGYTKLMGSCYFLHYSGVYSTTGGVPTLISRKIERYIAGATKEGLENASAGFKGLSVFFAIGDVTLYKKDGSLWKILSDVCLEFDVADQHWFVHTNVPADQLTTYIDSLGVERLLISTDTVGKSIKEFLTGSTDDGDIIFFRADTQPLQFSRSFEFYALPLEIISEIDRGASMECFVALDDNEFYPIIGNFQKGISSLKINSKDTKIVKPTPCRKIRISFRDSSKQICKVLQTAVIYSPTNITLPED